MMKYIQYQTIMLLHVISNSHQGAMFARNFVLKWYIEVYIHNFRVLSLSNFDINWHLIDMLNAYMLGIRMIAQHEF